MYQEKFDNFKLAYNYSEDLLNQEKLLNIYLTFKMVTNSLDKIINTKIEKLNILKNKYKI